MSESPRNRLILIGILVCLAMYTYLGVLLAPIQSESARLKIQLELSRKNVQAATSELKGLRARERAALAEADEDARAQELLAGTPRPYLVECPPAISKTFLDNSIADPDVNRFMLLPFRGVDEYAIAVWKIDAPEASALHFGEALATLENQYPLANVSELTLTANGAAGTVSVSMLFETAVLP